MYKRIFVVIERVFCEKISFSLQFIYRTFAWDFFIQVTMIGCFVRSLIKKEKKRNFDF